MFKRKIDMTKPIRTSAKALIIRDNKLLALKLRDADGEFFILPGGGQDGGELLPETVRREVAEELGVAVEVGDLAFVIEGRDGEAFHRVDLVFRCEYLGELEDAEHHSDTNQIGFDWLDIATLNVAPLYPSKQRRAIMNFAAGKPYPAYLGNESMGDPEVTD